MNKVLTSIACLFVLLGAPSAFPQNQQAASAEFHADDIIIVCPINGVIGEGIKVVVERAVREAEKMHAKAIVFRIDTPGGRVDSAVAITTAITNAPCPTIAYVEGMGAISAGALISFSCDDIIMTPGSAIGAATPVIATAQGMQPTGEKEVSFMRAKMRSLAESNGHNPDLAQAMVDKDIELRGYRNAEGKYIVYAVSGTTGPPEPEAQESTSQQPPSPGEDIVRRLTEPPPTEKPKEASEPAPQPAQPSRAPGTVVNPEGSELVLPAGKLLTMTPSEAEKYGLIPTIVDSLDEAVAYYGLGGGKYYLVEPNWAEKVFAFLTNPTVAGLLLLIGLGGLYFEVQTPGFGFPGIIGLSALALLFGAHFVLGLTDTIDLVLILAGILLLLAELFIIPGFGITGIAGIICLLLGTYLAFVDFTIPEYSWDYERLGEVGYSLTLAIVLFIVLVSITWRLLPRTPLYKTLVLGTTQEVAAGYSSPVQDAIEPQPGMRGVTVSMLRPVGRARFDDKTIQVVTRGAYMPKGTEVEIIQVDGVRVVVEQVEEHA